MFTLLNARGNDRYPRLHALDFSLGIDIYQGHVRLCLQHISNTLAAH